MKKEENKELHFPQGRGFREDYDPDNRFYLVERIGEFIVSTVDLGFDHSIGIGEPLYYETMIFTDGDYNPFEFYSARVTTEEQARICHRVTISLLDSFLEKQDFDNEDYF